MTEVEETQATIEWTTSYLSTSRVIYDVVSGVFDFSNPPNYGYTFSTLEEDTPASLNGVTRHMVVITGLAPGTTYYFRTISHASPDTIGFESTFTTAGLSGLSKGSLISLGSTESVAGLKSFSPDEESQSSHTSVGTGNLIHAGGESDLALVSSANKEVVKRELSQESNGTSLRDEHLGFAGIFAGWPFGNWWWLIFAIIIVFVAFLVGYFRRKEERI